MVIHGPAWGRTSTAEKTDYLLLLVLFLPRIGYGAFLAPALRILWSRFCALLIAMAALKVASIRGVCCGNGGISLRRSVGVKNEVMPRQH